MHIFYAKEKKNSDFQCLHGMRKVKSYMIVAYSSRFVALSKKRMSRLSMLYDLRLSVMLICIWYVWGGIRREVCFEIHDTRINDAKKTNTVCSLGNYLWSLAVFCNFWFCDAVKMSNKLRAVYEQSYCNYKDEHRYVYLQYIAHAHTIELWGRNTLSIRFKRFAGFDHFPEKSVLIIFRYVICVYN